jgi:hypothetical protein
MNDSYSVLNNFAAVIIQEHSFLYSNHLSVIILVKKIYDITWTLKTLYIEKFWMKKKYTKQWVNRIRWSNDKTNLGMSCATLSRLSARLILVPGINVFLWRGGTSPHCGDRPVQ